MTSGKKQQQLHFEGLPRKPLYYDGKTYEPEFDLTRLKGQTRRVYDLMIDGRYRTLNEISSETGDPEASVSARLRDLRKKRFGEHEINSRRRGDASLGLWEYQLLPSGLDPLE